MLAASCKRLIATVERAVREGPEWLVPVLLAQLAHVPPRLQAATVQRIVRDLPPERWASAVDADRVSALAEAARDVIVRAIDVLPPGRMRVETACRLAPLLAVHQRLEAFDGVLAGISPMTFTRSGKVFGSSHLHEMLVRTLPEPRREAWVAAQVARAHTNDPVFDELIVRASLGDWPAPDHRLWRDVSPDCPGHHRFVAAFPAALRRDFLARARARPDRLALLCHHGADLTDAECLAIVGMPARPPIRFASSYRREVVEHLRSVRAHLPRVIDAMRHAWLRTALALDELHAQQAALAVLAPAVGAADRARILEVMIDNLLGDDAPFADEWIVRTAPAPALAAIFAATIRRSGVGYVVLAEAIVASRDAETQERCFAPIVAEHGSLDLDTATGLVVHTSPWLAAQTRGVFPERIVTRWHRATA